MSVRDDDYCFVCGRENPIGMKLDFSLDGERIVAEFIPRKEHQGYMDIVHGGIISTLIDEAMVKIAIAKGIPAVTAEMSIRFKRVLNVGERVTISAEITNMRKRLIEAYAMITDNRGVLIAEARGKLIRVSM